MATRKLLTNGNAFKRTDGRWGGTVWYMDESGERKRKSFSGTTKQEVNKKMTAYIENFNNEIETSIEANKTLKDSMTSWLQVFKFPSVERTTYDRYKCTAENQIYPLIGNKIVGNITAADIKKVLNHWMNEGYAYTTVKKVHIILGDYFKYLTANEIFMSFKTQILYRCKLRKEIFTEVNLINRGRYFQKKYVKQRQEAKSYL